MLLNWRLVCTVREKLSQSLFEKCGPEQDEEKFLLLKLEGLQFRKSTVFDHAETEMTTRYANGYSNLTIACQSVKFRWEIWIEIWEPFENIYFVFKLMRSEEVMKLVRVEIQKRRGQRCLEVENLPANMTEKVPTEMWKERQVRQIS